MVCKEMSGFLPMTDPRPAAAGAHHGLQGRQAEYLHLLDHSERSDCRTEMLVLYVHLRMWRVVLLPDIENWALTTFPCI